MTTEQPHDLLRLSSPTVVGTDVPRWVSAAMTQMPWVVVRRGHPQPGHVLVGVRGHSRAERFGLEIPRSTVVHRVSPEQLNEFGGDHELPAFRALEAVRPILGASGLRWGPTGSVGFQLATGHRCVHRDSDLDVAVYADSDTDGMFEWLRDLHGALEEVPARVDCLVEFGWGAISLTELASDVSELMARSHDGPQLVSRSRLTSWP